MAFSRRGLFAVPPAVAATAILAPGAGTTDLALTCDDAAAPAVIAAARAFRQATGVRVRVFPTPPGLILPQLQRQIQNDIIVTRPSVIDQAEQASLVAPGGRTRPWRNPLVIATSAAGKADVFAVPDPSPGSDFDGIALLRRLGVTTGTIAGVIDTAAVAWMLTTGQARQGVLHQTEVVADDRLSAIRTVPESAWPPILYAATVTKLARRPDPGAFVRFLASPGGQTALRSAGLETAP